MGMNENCHNEKKPLLVILYKEKKDFGDIIK